MVYNVIEAIWFDKIGIVKVQTKYSGIKYYIGSSKGKNENEDEQWIAKHGLPVNRNIIKEFFKITENEKF